MSAPPQPSVESMILRELCAINRQLEALTRAHQLGATFTARESESQRQAQDRLTQTMNKLQLHFGQKLLRQLREAGHKVRLDAANELVMVNGVALTEKVRQEIMRGKAFLVLALKEEERQK